MPEHCITKSEWPNFEEVAAEKKLVHEPRAQMDPTKFTAYAGRTAYLEGVCKGINAFRGEGEE